MTALDLDRLLALREQATGGEWTWDGYVIESGYDEVTELSVDCMAYCYGGTARLGLSDADAALIVAAVNALPELVRLAREADRLRVEVDEGAIYDRLLAERRAACFCRPYSKPCTECGAFADGVESALAALSTSDGADQ